MITNSSIKDVIKVLTCATNNGRFYWNKPIESLYPIGTNYRSELSYFTKYQKGVFIVAISTSIENTTYTLLTKSQDETGFTAHNNKNELQEELKQLHNLISEKTKGSYALINALLNDASLF